MFNYLSGWYDFKMDTEGIFNLRRFAKLFRNFKRASNTILLTLKRTFLTYYLPLSNQSGKNPLPDQALFVSF